MSTKKQDVKILLKDYMNFLPPGPQSAFVPVGAATGGLVTSDWPITPEAEKRMDKTSLVGETYDLLEKALVRLDDEYPLEYNAVLRVYLREEAGHRDEDFLRSKIAVASNNLVELLFDAECGVDHLVEYLKDEDLYVRYAQKAAGPRPGQNMEDKHGELFAIFMRYYDDLPYRQALTNATFKMQDETGKPYYSRRHADRIIKKKLKEHDEEG